MSFLLSLVRSLSLTPVRSKLTLELSFMAAKVLSLIWLKVALSFSISSVVLGSLVYWEWWG